MTNSTAYGHHPDSRVDIAAQAIASKHWHWEKLGEDERDRFRDRARDVLAALDAMSPAVQSAPCHDPHGWVTWWPRPGGGHSPIYSHGATKPSYGPELNALLTVYPVFAATAI